MNPLEKALIRSWLVAHKDKINTNYLAYVKLYNTSLSRIPIKQRSITKITNNLIKFVHHLLNLWIRRSDLNYENYYVQHSDSFQRIYRNYEIIREYCLHKKGYSNHLLHEADHLIGWKQPFVDFAMLWVEQTQSYKVTGPNCRYALGDDRTKYQKNTPGRCYDWRINIKKDIRSKIFKDCYDIDMVSAHPNIYWTHIKNQKSNNPDFNMMIHQPNLFLNKIIRSKIHHIEITYNDETPLKKAKQFRSRLFYPMKNGVLTPLRNTGCRWYDTLATEIYNGYEDNNITNPEAYLTLLERKYMDTFISKINSKNVLLLCHDGFINATDLNQEITKWNSKNSIKFKQQLL